MAKSDRSDHDDRVDVRRSRDEVLPGGAAEQGNAEKVFAQKAADFRGVTVDSGCTFGVEHGLILERRQLFGNVFEPAIRTGPKYHGFARGRRRR